MLFAFGDEMWPLIHVQATCCICIFFILCVDLFMYGCECISYININPNDTVESLEIAKRMNGLKPQV